MDESDLQALERFVVENDDLLALEEQIGRFNIFDALGIARIEIRHSNYLAWVLTPGESHGQGDLLLKALLMDMLRQARKQGVVPPVSPIELDGADLHSVEIRREWRNIDMLIICEEPKFVVAIENKVHSDEHSDQLNRYERIVASQFADFKRLFVFLTPEGGAASDADWILYSYADLHAVLSRVKKINAGAIGGDVAVFLDHYLSLIGNRFMENEEIDKLCRQIYSNHKRAIDLIRERVGSPASRLAHRIADRLKDQPDRWTLLAARRRDVEFIPNNWAGMLPAVGVRKDLPSAIWITARFDVEPRRLMLRVVMSPTTDAAIRKSVLARSLQDKNEFGFSSFFKNREIVKEYMTLMSDEVASFPEDDEPDLEAVVRKVEKHLDSLALRTANLPAALATLTASR